MVVGKAGNKWQVIKCETGSGKPWRSFAPTAVCRDMCQCKSYPTWGEALAHANGTADLA